LRLHSPPLVQESEHRLSIGFRSNTPVHGGEGLASPLELVFAARSTASFPGAFPPLDVEEIDRLAKKHEMDWPGREAFLTRLMPEHVAAGNVESVSLIDGSVLVNAPFSDAMGVLRSRPAHREVDRRFVYIDPRPDRVGGIRRGETKRPGFFSVILGSLSSIPREQPIRDNLEELERQSREMATLQSIVRSLRPEVEQAVEKLFGRTLFFDSPTVRRLSSWRSKAQNAAASKAGYAYHGYVHLKFSGIVERLSKLIRSAAPDMKQAALEPIAAALTAHLERSGLDTLSGSKGGASDVAVDFFRDHDLAFRIRRLRLLARRLSQEWEQDDDVSEADRDAARDTVYGALALYLDREAPESMGQEFPELAARVLEEPGAVLDAIAARRKLRETDALVDSILASAMAKMPPILRRRVLLSYLGFPYYDTITLPLLRGEGLNEFDPVKVDRISPDDALSIREGGAHATLRGVEFYNFGAFFSRAYRENDYLWGRLHGAERMIDLVASALDGATIPSADLATLKHEAFLAILDEEEERLRAEPGLVPGIRAEVLARQP
jgi:patatin-related protein